MRWRARLINGLEIYLQDTWSKVLETIKKGDLVDELFFTTYFEETKLFTLSDSVCTVSVNNFIQVSILSEYEKYISEILSGVINMPVTCQFVPESEIKQIGGSQEPEEPPLLNYGSAMVIIPEYTFENFIVGDSNRESQAAALAATVNPGKFYNPLFIYGGPGLGKTHLLHAIGNYINNRSPELEVLLLTAADFVDGVYKSKLNLDVYKKQLSSVDVFLVDEIQFLADKKKSDEIFFHVFNELVNKKKQIVLTSDRPPQDIKGLEARLVSRFASGLTVSISAPEFETAVRIIKSKLDRQTQRLDIDDSVIDYIAVNYSNDVRNLEGVLNRLIFNLINTADKERIDMPFALSVLKDSGKIGKDEKELTPKTIKRAVIEYYGLNRGQLEGKSRATNITLARHVAMYLCRKHLDLPYQSLGDEFGKRDHSTVISACDRIEKLIKVNNFYKTAISKIEDLFLAQS